MDDYLLIAYRLKSYEDKDNLFQIEKYKFLVILQVGKYCT